MVSSDLAHWQQLPIALLPDTVYDNNGVFSGSTTVVNGTPILLYTGLALFAFAIHAHFMSLHAHILIHRFSPLCFCNTCSLHTHPVIHRCAPFWPSLLLALFILFALFAVAIHVTREKLKVSLGFPVVYRLHAPSALPFRCICMSRFMPQHVWRSC